MDIQTFKEDVEGGLNRKDISTLHPSELGAIIWQYRSGANVKYIANRLNIKLYQVTQYIKDTENRMRAILS